MKKISSQTHTSPRKLHLRTEIVRALTDKQLALAYGGACRCGSGDTKMATTVPNLGTC